MTDQKPDRPADLRSRRQPQAAPDERIDPVDYRQSEPQPFSASRSVSVTTVTPSASPAPRRGRPRREVTVPFSTRLTPDVLELIDAAVADGEGTIRSVVEAAIRATYGKG